MTTWKKYKTFKRGGLSALRPRCIKWSPLGCKTLIDKWAVMQSRVGRGSSCTWPMTAATMTTTTPGKLMLAPPLSAAYTHTHTKSWETEKIGKIPSFNKATLCRLVYCWYQMSAGFFCLFVCFLCEREFAHMSENSNQTIWSGGPESPPSFPLGCTPAEVAYPKGPQSGSHTPLNSLLWIGKVNSGHERFGEEELKRRAVRCFAVWSEKFDLHSEKHIRKQYQWENDVRWQWDFHIIISQLLSFQPRLRELNYFFSFRNGNLGHVKKVALCRLQFVEADVTFSRSRTDKSNRAVQQMTSCVHKRQLIKKYRIFAATLVERWFA